MMNVGLVSIVVPCFNYEKMIERFFNSVLSQTYKNIEVIVVDDGSTDRSKEVILSWVSVFEKQGMILRYYYQDNSGLGAAINTGIKNATGEFLCWADPDDFYYPTSIEKRVFALYNNPSYGIVSSDANVLNSDDLIHPIKREAQRFVHRFEENQFEYLIKEESHFCPGCHMVRMSAFDDVNPNRTIYPARRGQDWQLLLPVYYKYKRIYIDEPLYAYVLYSNSMSRGDNTEKKELDRWEEHETIIRNTLSRIPLSTEEKKKYDRLIAERYAKKRFFTAIDYKDKKLLKRQYDILRSLNSNAEEIKRAYYRNINILFKIFYIVKGIIVK